MTARPHAIRSELLPDTVTLYVRKKDGRWCGSTLRRVQIVRNEAGADDRGSPSASGRVLVIHGEAEADKPYADYADWMKLSADEQTGRWTVPTDGSGVILLDEGEPSVENPLDQPGAFPLKTARSAYPFSQLYLTTLYW